MENLGIQGFVLKREFIFHRTVNTFVLKYSSVGCFWIVVDTLVRFRGLLAVNSLDTLFFALELKGQLM